jgi:hypothetical protein
VDRVFNPEELTEVMPKHVYGTRSKSQTNLREPKSITITGPANGGSSFVDLTLGVVVRQTKGTMMAIRPEFLHGTTKSYGGYNVGYSIPFSKRLGDAWEKAQEGLIEVEFMRKFDH